MTAKVRFFFRTIFAFLLGAVPATANDFSFPIFPKTGDCMGVAQTDFSLATKGVLKALPLLSTEKGADWGSLVSGVDAYYFFLPVCQRRVRAINEHAQVITWDLVAQKTSNGMRYQVWYDRNSGLLWGDRLDGLYTHFQAIKYDFLGDIAEETACASVAGQRANAGILSEKWGLPTDPEFEQAERDGMRQVLPNIDAWFWSAHLYPNSELAGEFGGRTGLIGIGVREYYVLSVRCVIR
jgi:hypothetical protein